MFDRTVYIFMILLHSMKSDTDVNGGYILFCPCMGRFGNQADYFVGSLAFAKALNRTLVLPPWIEYKPYQTYSIQVPFSTYFRTDTFSDYHRVMTMEDFMDNVAPHIWPPEKRIAFCYMNRKRSKKDKPSCDAKYGNPAESFWSTYDIDFVGSEFFGPLSYDVDREEVLNEWNVKYSASKWPVIAFAGSPASYPIQKQHVPLQKYFVWNDEMKEKAKKVVKKLPKAPFIGIHIRNGIDWKRACDMTEDVKTNLFSSSQCLGYKNEFGPLTSDLCFPSWDIIVRQLKKAINKYNASGVFVASDTKDHKEQFKKAFKNTQVKFVSNKEDNPHVDLIVLARSHYFIGNCVSSFSAFAQRDRDVKGFPSGFWAFPIKRKIRDKKQNKHTEL